MTNSSNNPARKDVLIIGGGPAGLSAFHRCHELGMSCVLLERHHELGGQLLSIHNPILNYLGRTAANGRELLGYFLAQIEDLENGTIINDPVIEFDPQQIRATLSGGLVVEARSAILATGVRRRRLGIPGEKEFVGRGILESGAVEKRSVTGKRVAIVGGGDAALENALMLSEYAEKVYVIHRRSHLSARSEFVNSSVGHPKMEFILDSIVTQLTGDKQLSAIEVLTPSARRVIEVQAVLIRIGVEPNSDLFRDAVHRDERGYIATDRLGQTNIKYVYAIGDLANPAAPTISTAIGTAAIAAKALYNLLYHESRL